MTNEPKRAITADLKLVCEIVSAYVSNNHIASADLGALIATVHTTLGKLNSRDAAEAVAESEAEMPTLAQIRKSLSRDALISFIDGRGYKTLKRHLNAHGLTPEAYRAKFGLSSDYPMVAPSYSETRSSLAKSSGLGDWRSRRADSARAATASKGGKRLA